MRLAASLLVAAAALFGVLALGISWLGRAAGGDGYRLPGTQAILDPLAVTLLGACAIGAGALGTLLLVAAPTPRLSVQTQPRRFRAGRAILILAAGVLALAVAFLVRSR